VKKGLSKIDQKVISNDDSLSLTKLFHQTWFLLDAFDKGIELPTQSTKSTIKIESAKLYQAITKFKEELMSQNLATKLFAQEKTTGALEGILGNIFQSAFGEEVYPSLESKAVHLMYFIIKNHPFTDGNKRTGAFAFIWFLQKAKVEFKDKITPEALTAITLLIAQSNIKDKERIVNLIVMLIRR